MIRRMLCITLLTASLPALAVDRYEPGSANDPMVRSAEFLIGDKRYLSASTDLLQLLGDKPDRQLSPQYFRRLADSTLNFGIEQRANTIYREQVSEPKTALSLAKARLQLAEYQYQRGKPGATVAELQAMKPTLPKSLTLEWQDLLGRALLAQGRYGEAANVLAEIKDAGPQRAFTLYNYGVALIKDGRVGQGLNVLDRVGQIDASEPDELALRDKANLALGYHFLRAKQGGTAVGVFQRIRSDGPMSNRALLGLGWAYLAPTGKSQKKVSVGDEVSSQGGGAKPLSTIGVLLRPGFLSDDIYRRAGLQAFRLTKASAEEEAALKKALVPWVELATRDPIDPAVQEVLLAIPFTLDKLGAHLQAESFYKRAIDALSASRKNLDLTAAYVRSGRMVSTMVRRTANVESGWAWELKDLPDAQETYYLQNLIAENRFQEPLKNYRDALLLERNLNAWKARIADTQAGWLARKGPAITTEQLVNRQLVKPQPAAPATGAASTAAAPAPTGKPVSPPINLKATETLSAADAAMVSAVPLLTETPISLLAAQAPPSAAFKGIYERLEALKTRIDTVLPQVEATSKAQSKLIDKLALDLLDEQRRSTEKYLIEARFAMARIYDRQLKGEAP